jgi:hypothetical protein
MALAYLTTTVLAADCTSNPVGGKQMITEDITTLANDISNHNLASGSITDPAELKASHSISFEHGTVRFCIENDFLFENTHLAFGDIASAAQDVASQCCSGEQCNGGKFTIKGDTGLSTIMTVQNILSGCSNTIQASTAGVSSVLSDLGDAGETDLGEAAFNRLVTAGDLAEQAVADAAAGIGEGAAAVLGFFDDKKKRALAFRA